MNANHSANAEQRMQKNAKTGLIIDEDGDFSLMCPRSFVVSVVFLGCDLRLQERRQVSSKASTGERVVLSRLYTNQFVLTKNEKYFTQPA
ncbi:MAG: hypothetical protein WBN92_02390 [Terriglobia bacterium]